MHHGASWRKSGVDGGPAYHCWVSDSPDAQPTEALTRRSVRDAKPPGLAELFAKHPTAWIASVLGVVFLLLGTGAVFAGIATGSASGATVPTPTPTPTMEPRPVPTALPASSRLRTCSVTGLATDPRLMQFSGYVVNASNGEVLFDRAGTTPARTGSVLKVLTAAAAISVLGPNAQLSTRVIDGSAPGTIVLVGGGDPTLSAASASFYDGAPRLADLAAQATAEYQKLYPDVPITEIILDATMWDPSDKWDSSWLRKEQQIGYQSEVTALMVDGDRENPARSTSPRGTDPIGRAGQAFANAMGLPGVTLSLGSAVSGRQLLGEVKSQPISTLINQMLQSSDNTLAEMLARVVSKTMGFNGSAASLAKAIPGALNVFELDTAGVVIRDGSGLSDLNSVSPAFVTQLMSKVMAGAQGLDVVYAGLPVAGKSGSLASRFTGDNAVARGSVIAKTGWLDAAYSLAGIVNSADGTRLSFAFYAIGDGIGADAKVALDTLTTGIFRCGDNLSNN